MLKRQESNLEAIIAAAKKALATAHPTLTDLPAFAGNFFQNAVLEDIEKLTSDTLAHVAKQVFDYTEIRQPGQFSIHFDALEFVPAGEDRTLPVTAITIINDNMPFLVDSVMGYLQEQSHGIHLVLHPIMDISRDAAGDRTAFHGRAKRDGKQGIAESVIYILIDRIAAVEAIEEVSDDIRAILANTRVVVNDWQAMRQRLHQAIGAFKYNPPPIPVDEIAEAIQFLEWLVDDNFTFLGMREYAFVSGEETERMDRVSESGLGILRDPHTKVLRRGSELVTITPEIREFLMQPVALIITKANTKSTVHRRVHMDYVGVKQFDADGQLISELRVVGLFTATAYTKSVHTIPYLRKKVDRVFERSALDTESHTGRALMNVLENYPRDELFQIDDDTLYEFSTAIELLDERPRIRVLARPDKFDRFVSVLVFVPRDRFNTDVRIAVGDYLTSVFDGRLSAYYPAYPDGVLARVHYVIGRYEGATPQPSQEELEEAVTALVRTWEDALRETLENTEDPSRARAHLETFHSAFDPAYRHAFSAETAVEDIAVIEKLTPTARLAAAFRPRDTTDGVIDLKIYHLGAPIPLSDRMPIIENMGFRAVNERTYRVTRSGDPTPPGVWIHDVAVKRPDDVPIDLKGIGGSLQATLMAVFGGRAEDDGYNGLTLLAGIAWRDITIIRAYSRYIRQIPLLYSQDYMWQTLGKHPDIARRIIALFHHRFSPHRHLDEDACEAAQTEELAAIEAELEAVQSIDEDRIIRTFTMLIQATLRTNFFQIGDDGMPKPTLALKLDPDKIDGLPAPRPYREIFVYSPRVEGVHLRGGAIARGGLRWSDRPQDFRTEILGLAKAQQVKNAVIVPVGAKGGFVPKQLPAGGTREAVFEEGREAYKIFIASLLDVTDNLVGGEVMPPENVMRIDGDDPYLVVAADKGTATFSDTANAISEKKGHWLGDAFASGGSAGYDHKKMAITARGAWEAVKRHFREMDIDIQTTPFTVVGCGDMSGDVFGNGMLLSEKIKLLAAFDHRDIFIDPDPDPATSFAERQRLFDLGRSSWQDYSKELISNGGGVFSRSLKTIDLPDRARVLLNIEKKAPAPLEVINAILKADADLLWFGGIGTYVRSFDETNGDAGDRANDAVRITAKELNVKVVGEGANLGMTQLARIEFALNGGRVNTDAIDNSAGVNSSDVEVNIKIALGAAERAGKLEREARNILLADMTDEVADLVLRNNYQQTLSLSLTERRGLDDIEFQVRMMRDLEARGLLDRAVEFLPNTEVLNERIEHGQPLTRPELAVLLAYAKIALFAALLDSQIPDDLYFAEELRGYFPTGMRDDYAGEIVGHRLRREIIATLLSNSMINRGGPTFVHRLADQTGANTAEIANAFALTRESYRLRDLNSAIGALDNKVGGTLQLDLYERVQDLTMRQTLWYLRNAVFDEGLEAAVNEYRGGLDTLRDTIAGILPEDAKDHRQSEIASLVEAGVAEELAAHIADLPYMSVAPDIILIGEASGADLTTAARAFFNVGQSFGMGRMVRTARQLKVSDYFDRIALNRAVDTILEAQRRLSCDVIGAGADGKDLSTVWTGLKAERADSARAAIADISSETAVSVSKITVAAGILLDLTEV